MDASASPRFSNLMEIPDDEASYAVGLPVSRAMTGTPIVIKDLPHAYALVVDVPGVKPGEIEIRIEEGKFLVISGERKEEEEEAEAEGIKYLKMDRRVGKLMLKFSLPENADTENVSAVCKDGVLTVTVKKLPPPPPEPKKPKTVEVQIADDDDLGGFSGLLEIILMWFFVYMFLKLYEHLF